MTEAKLMKERSGAESRFLEELRNLYLSRGEPSYNELSRRARRSRSTIHNVLSGGRIASWSVIESIVEALDGDVDHFRKFFELIRSEHLGLGERADELGSELGLPASQTVQNLETTVNSHGGSVFIQTGGITPFNPLSIFAPSELVSTYESACRAYAEGAHLATLALVRTLIEAVDAREAGNHAQPPMGIDVLLERGTIPAHLAERGREVYRLATMALHGTQPAHPNDAAASLSFALAFLSCVYIGGRA